MSEEFLGDRRKALEDQFFQKENERKTKELRERLAQQQAKDQLTDSTGIKNAEILDKLTGLGITAETLAALALVPLVEVAWADGNVAGGERRAILEAAAEEGLKEGHPAFDLLGDWLENRPPAPMLEAWTAYIHGLCDHLDEAERGALRTHLLGQARIVAKAAGGILGIGMKISAKEEAMLNILEHAFDA